MAVRPRAFKICCKNCSFEKIIQFKSDAIGGNDMMQIPQVCPECGSGEFERRGVTSIEAMTGTSIQKIANSLKDIFKQ